MAIGMLPGSYNAQFYEYDDEDGVDSDESYDDANGAYSWEPYDGSYESFYGWGDDLLVSARFGSERLGWDGELLLLFRIQDHGPRAVKLVVPGLMHENAIRKKWEALPESRREGTQNSELRYGFSGDPPIFFLDHKCMADGHLFSVVQGASTSTKVGPMAVS